MWVTFSVHAECVRSSGATNLASTRTFVRRERWKVHWEHWVQLTSSMEMQHQSIIPDVLGIMISAVHGTRRQKNRGLSVFPVALWLQVLIKCLNDFPACSVSQILLESESFLTTSEEI